MQRRRVRHHINPLQTSYMGVVPLQGAPLFAGTSRPLEVELGCADAEFLFQRAALFPENQYVGIEIRRELVRRVNARAAQEGNLPIQAVFAHLHFDLPALFVRESVARFFINFPDPWFKKDQHKRRLVQPAWVQSLLSFLQPGGDLFFQSDVFDLALDAMAVFEQNTQLDNCVSPWSFFKQNPYGARSLREIRVEEKGLPVWRMRYKKSAQREPCP